MATAPSAPEGFARFSVRDAARGDVIDELPIDDADAVAAAVARARAAQPAWAALPVARARAARSSARGARWCAIAPQILDLLERETGKARFDVVGELMGVCLDIGYLARRAPRWLAPRARQHAAAVRQARLRRLQAARRRRHHQPVERAAQPGARRRRAGAARRQRGRHQAVGADAARGAARRRRR